jgi:Viral BACON domain
MVMKKSSMFLILAVGLCVFLTAPSGFTQDAGVRDSCDMVFSVIPDATTGTLKLRADLWVFNDSDKISGFSVPFHWDNTNLQIDSAKTSALTLGAFDYGPFFYEGESIALTNTNHNFLFGGVVKATGIPRSTSRQLWASYYFTLSAWSATDSIVIDTFQFSDGLPFIFVDEASAEYIPVWKGRKVVRDTASPSNMIVTPDSLHYSGIAGGASPATQSFVVSSDNQQLSISVVEAVSWIIPTPLVGTTPRTVNVAVNTNFMAAGDYKDSIRINSSGADNSPQWVMITLHLDPPPPTIGFSPSSLNFNAIANGANPASKNLNVSNNGASGSTLNWSVTKSQSWLSLAPTSGTDLGSVTVSVDITGLIFGDYYDTIVITGTGATNNPQKVPVKLTVGSDLPMIKAIDQYNYWIIPADSPSVAPKKFVVTNSGSGALTFTVAENSARIFSLSVASGVAGDTVAVTLKMASIAANTDYMDTVWVTSPEATNSPYPVVFLLHSIDNPAMLDLGPDTLSFTIYECDMGKDVPFPTGLFAVGSNLQDGPVSFNLSYESDWFTIDLDSGYVEEIVEVSTKDAGLPVGIYYDSIKVTAQKALNSPQYMIIKINKSAGDFTPRIVTTTGIISIPTQELNGPILGYVQAIDNEFGGCMPWTVSESIPWLNIVSMSGDVPGSIDLIAEATPSYPFGQYPDSFFVAAADASNSPRKMNVILKVWRYFGDVNYDKRLNIVDIVYLTRYLFQGGPPPQPEFRVGDTNCDELINVVDVVKLISYLFKGGDILCGNPSKK